MDDGDIHDEDTIVQPSEPSGATLTLTITLFMIVGTFVQFALGVLAPFIVGDFSISRAQLGALTTAHFVIAASFAPLLGRAVDRLSARIACSILFLVPTASLIGLAIAPMYLFLIVFAGVAGVGQALANPLSNKLIAEHVPPSRQGSTIGIKQAGVPMATTLAGIFLPFLADSIGWRAALAGSSLLVALAWMLTARHIPVRTRTVGKRGLVDRVINRNVIAITTYAFLMGSCGAIVITYLPLYAHEALGFPAAIAGSVSGAIGLVGIASRISIGYASDRLTDMSALLAPLTLTAAGAVSLFLMASALGAPLVWLGALLYGASASWNVVAMLALIKIVGSQSTGQASGFVMAGFFGGFILAPLGFGSVVDAQGDYMLAWSTLAVILLATSLTTCVWRIKLRSR